MSANSYLLLFASVAGQPAAQSAPPIQITVGDERVTRLLQEALPMVDVRLTPIWKHKRGEIHFLQDGQVVLPSGDLLIPHEMETEYNEFLFTALLPSALSHYVGAVRKGYGRGMRADFRGRTIDAANRDGAKFIEARSCIEGGNTRFATKPTGERVAIVGVNSQILSLMALQKQQYFDSDGHARYAELLKDAQPTDDDFRMARNAAYARKLIALRKDIIAKRAEWEEKLAKRILETPEEMSSRRAAGNDFQTHLKGMKGHFNGPVTEEDMDRFDIEAKEYHAKLQLTAEVMAQELQVSLENLAIVPHLQFHIDMELFTHGSTVYLHSSRGAQTDLESFSFPNRPVYQKSAQEEAEIQSRFLDAEIAILAQRDLSVVEVSGVYGIYDGQPVNFMNGFVVHTPEGPKFVTNGVHHKFQDAAERFKKQIEPLPVHFIAEGEDLMQDMLRTKTGSLNCLVQIRNPLLAVGSAR